MKCMVVRGRLSGSGRPEPADSADRIPERGSVPFRSGSVPALPVCERSLLFTPSILDEQTNCISFISMIGQEDLGANH